MTSEPTLTEDDWDWIKLGYMNGSEHLRSGSIESYEKIFDDFKQKILQALQENPKLKFDNEQKTALLEIRNRREDSLVLEITKLKAEIKELKEKADLWDEHDIEYCKKSSTIKMFTKDESVADLIKTVKSLQQENQSLKQELEAWTKPSNKWRYSDIPAYHKIKDEYERLKQLQKRIEDEYERQKIEVGKYLGKRGYQNELDVAQYKLSILQQLLK